MTLRLRRSAKLSCKLTLEQSAWGAVRARDLARKTVLKRPFCTSFSERWCFEEIQHFDHSGIPSFRNQHFRLSCIFMLHHLVSVLELLGYNILLILYWQYIEEQVRNLIENKKYTSVIFLFRLTLIESI